ncbi:MAG: hypothetical protein QF634_02145 [Vicinamibacterales bacterium]|nr:hypothetical protein [Vicinamibacterales bacterium]
MIEACHQSHVKLLGVTCWRNFHIPPALAEAREVGYSHYWHNDAQAIHTIKLFVALSDVDEQDGPLHVLPMDVSRRVMNWRFSRKRVRHAERLNAGASRMVGPRGTATLGNATLCLHRAGIPAPGRHRDMLQFLFKAHPTRDLRPPTGASRLY